MSIIFDPAKMLRKVAPPSKIRRMISHRMSLKRTVLAHLGTEEFPINKKSVANVIKKTLNGYKERIANADSATDERSTISSDPKQLIQRVQNEVVLQIHSEIKSEYGGQKARWLPSDADEPRPEHQLNYGKEYIIGEGIDGVEPGDEYGCRCGVEILTDETKLDL